MILIDSSAWVEFLRRTESRVDRRVQALLKSGQRPGTTEIVVMELLAGAVDDAQLLQLRRLLGSCDFLPLEGLGDYEEAAALYRQCRRAGTKRPSLTDCLIAVVAIRNRAEVLHADRDFDSIARQSTLQIASLTAGR